MNTAKLMVRGAGLRFISFFISVIVAFFLVPFVIHQLGDRYYGLWTLVGSLLGIYSVFDIGLSSATQRYLAHALPRNDADELNTVIGTSLAFFCLIGVLTMVVTVVAAAMTPVFVSDHTDVTTVQYVILIMGSGAALAFPFYVIFGIFTANLRYDWTSYVQIGKLLIRSAAFVIVLNTGYSVVAMATISVLVDLLSYAILSSLARHLALWLSLSPRYFSWNKAKELFDFGIFTFIGGLSHKLRFEIDGIVVSAFLGLVPLTHYNIAERLAHYVTQMLGSLLGGMIPALTSLYSEGRQDELQMNFIFLSKISILATCIVGGSAVIFGHQFILLWVGDKYADAYEPLILLALTAALSAIHTPSISLFFAMARHRIVATINMAEAVANLALSLILVHSLGLMGVALGTLLPALVSKLFFQPYYTCRLLNLPVRTYCQSLGSVLLIGIALQCFVALLAGRLMLNSYLSLFGAAAILCSIVGVLSFIIALTRTERTRLIRAANFAATSHH